MDEANVRPDAVRHERNDADVRLLARYLVLLVIGVVAVYLSVAGFWRYATRKEVRRPVVSRWAAPSEVPPEPRLQVAPERDLQQMLQQDLTYLNSYGWSDPNRGLVHIPIERAMEELVQKGLPARAMRAPEGPGEERRNEPGAH
jgi:hypothetical protein